MKEVNTYIAKGLNPRMAQYFANGRKRIICVEPKDDFTLVIDFDNGEKRLLDMKPMLQQGGVFAHIRKIEDFRRVYVADHSIVWDIDPNVDSKLVWNNQIDLCPDCCYVDSVPL